MEHPDYWRRPEFDTIDDLEGEVEDLKAELLRLEQGDQNAVPVPHAPGWIIDPPQARGYEALVDVVRAIQAAMYGDGGPDVMAIHAALKHMDLAPYEHFTK